MKVTKEQLRDFYINYHGFNEFFDLDPSEAIDNIFGRLGSVQFDPLNVVARNAELVLFSRNKNVSRKDLYDALYKERKLIDGWDKMMCIYSTKEFPKFAYVREQSARNYECVMSWRGQTECHKYTQDIYSYIERNGATLVTDIPSEKTNGGGWGSSRVANVCCEYLWNSGRIVVTDKKGVVKSFDVTERVLGADALGNAFDGFGEFIAWYVKRRIASVGAVWDKNGGAWLGLFVEKGEGRTPVLRELEEKGEITALEVEGEKSPFYICAGAERYFERSNNDRAVIVAPLDNMIWDRKMIKNIFAFDYSWEVYAPAAKRKYGYYVLPVLIGNRFVGRIEPFRDNSDGKLVVKNIWYENGYVPCDGDVERIEQELTRLADFTDSILEKNVRDKLRA